MAARSPGLRSTWPLVAAAVLCVLFLVFHFAVFRPLAARYQGALDRAAALGLMVDPSHPATQLPISPRLFALLADNSLPAAEADRRSQSGSLAAEMVQTLSTAAARRGLETVVAEPGLLTQQPGSIEVRAHLSLRGSYSSFVGLLDDLARGGRLWTVERFIIRPSTGASENIEVWMGCCVLKHTEGAR
jgi:hypothetical protein